MLIISHPTSNQFNRALVNSIADQGLLTEFHTTLASFPGNLLDRLSKLPFLSEIERRNFDPKLEEFTKSNPLLEMGRMASTKFNIHQLTAHESGFFSVDSVYEKQDKIVKKRLKEYLNNEIKAVYAYEDGALHSFRLAKNIGIKRFYDLPIGYWRASRDLLNIEKEKWPEYAMTLTGLKDSDLKLNKKDEELELAQHIFVASTFTKNTLDKYPGKLAQINVIPYGFPPVAINRKYSTPSSNKLRVLFVGGLSQRKGIAYVFEAVEKLKNDIALTVIGMKASNSCKKLDEELKKHTWIPTLSHQKVLEAMRNHDILVFPSLFEGFGMVITEAMSQGTPVITTDRTAGPDLIKDGENGWIIKSSSTSSLVCKLEEILLDPTLCERVGKKALETARKRPWEVYGNELTSAIKSYLN
ncbi:glycosyltransferase family 4 protein [Autumnicola psychrophila]|uniref:Glycosyltransferase family 4 protein n=1 Tax=Autumnicola psychrophila TaxID=3075592 RepID=A0ABU3DQR5_9FLAO|nr:glycosyltransferase family 4 protein [Zunongwangia sp. F225]MDT0686057.1 glycosyltransferase family 4 protein [Zunongwangia sp. F225]